MPKTILFIAHRIPYPPNKGDKIRSFNILKHLSQKYEIHLACMVDDPSDLRYLHHLQKYAKTVTYDTINPLMKKALSATALITGESISAKYFYSHKMQKEIDQLLESDKIDTIFCSSSPTAEYIFKSKYYPEFKAERKLYLDLIDVDSYKWKQYAGIKRGPVKWIYLWEAKALKEYEKRISREFLQIFLVSDAEKKILERYVCSAINATAIPNGVDLAYFSPENCNHLNDNHAYPNSDHGGPSLVFTGAMDYWPNIDGVIWFANHIFPKVRSALPQAHFYIVGNNPSPAVVNLNKRQGITVTGFVKDIREYLALSDICVIPLRIARGVQNKVLEAMAMGKTVVCTPNAAEGINAISGTEIILAGEENEFAEAIIDLLEHRKQMSQIGYRARERMLRSYSWSSNLDKLTRQLESHHDV